MNQVLSKIGQVKANIDISGASTARSASLLSELLELQLLQNPKYQLPQALMPFRQKIFSHDGQDGILAEIFRRIGAGGGRFVEIGTAPAQNNSNLLLLKGWRGLWLDAALPKDELLSANLQVLVREGKLKISRKLVGRDNARTLLSTRGFAEDLDLISISIDYNTHHVFTELLAFRPRVFCVAYNGMLPADLDWAAPYDAKAVWDGSTLFGATLGTISAAAETGGYSLVGCELSGTDAFFVRHDLLKGRFLRPGDAMFHWEPLRMHLGQIQRLRTAMPLPA
ncbi:hypothetical protein [Prosthecobacter sp.]|uniref:hypothetical protein n=1 Tax=Prosthecobacter sp. TaxID=1965333 RepID=UPI003784F838